MRIFLILFVVFFPRLSIAAPLFEPDGTVEREPFPWITTSVEGFEIADQNDDLVVFDPLKQATLPPVLADLVSITGKPTESGWRVEFILHSSLPENPDMPVNFQFFIDRDGEKINNASDGVFRAGSDTAVLLLFGKRTKWHTMTWTYTPANHKWVKGESFPPFEAPVNGDRKRYAVTIPYSILPRRAGIKVRGFTLTDSERRTAVDVAPGRGLPPIKK